MNETITPSKLLKMQNAIESFDPRLLKYLEQGTTRRVVIPGNTKLRPPDPETGEPDSRTLEERQRDAVKVLRYMANRMRALRRVLVDSDDPRGRLLYRTVVRNVDTRRIELIVEPRDAQISDLLDDLDSTATPDPENENALDELAKALE